MYKIDIKKCKKILNYTREFLCKRILMLEKYEHSKVTSRSMSFTIVASVSFNTSFLELYCNPREYRLIAFIIREFECLHE